MSRQSIRNCGSSRRSGVSPQSVSATSCSSSSCRDFHLKRLLFKVLSLFLLGSFLFLLPSCIDRKYTIKERVTGYRGEAKRNPYLAAMRFLEQEGISSKESSRVQFDPYINGTIVIPASVLKGKSEVAEALDYLKEGGHLVVTLEKGEKDYNDFWERTWFYEDDDLDRDVLNDFAKNFKINISWSDNPENDGEYTGIMRNEAKPQYEVPNANSVIIPLVDGSYSARIGGSYAFEDYAEFDDEEGEYVFDGFDGGHYKFLGDTYKNSSQDKVKFISKGYSSGRITFISDGRLFRNPHLGTQNHASILRSLVELSENDTLLFSSGEVPSFMDLMWKNYKYFCLSLLLILLVWIISKAQRFGPILEIVYQQPLNYLNNIEASGHFLWKHKRENYLLSALITKAKHSAGLENLSAEKYEARLLDMSKEFEVTHTQLQQAFSNTGNSEPNGFIDTVQLLQKIIQRYE